MKDFDGDVVRGQRRRLPGLDLVRVQDAGLPAALDPSLTGGWEERDETADAESPGGRTGRSDRTVRPGRLCVVV
jgi:hypothetical protein